MLTFDLPRNANQVRLRFWRWLRANHFGNLQGSVWITPDPVPTLEATAKEAGFDPTAVLVFTGSAADNLTPREIAETAWDFATINANYRSYQSFAENAVAAVGKNKVPPDRLGKVLKEDRRLWWKALRPDPLLPKPLLPRNYEALRSWKVRRKLHKTLFRRLEFLIDA